MDPPRRTSEHAPRTSSLAHHSGISIPSNQRFPPSVSGHSKPVPPNTDPNGGSVRLPEMDRGGRGHGQGVGVDNPVARAYDRRKSVAASAISGTSFQLGPVPPPRVLHRARTSSNRASDGDQVKRSRISTAPASFQPPSFSVVSDSVPGPSSSSTGAPSGLPSNQYPPDLPRWDVNLVTSGSSHELRYQPQQQAQAQTFPSLSSSSASPANVTAGPGPLHSSHIPSNHPERHTRRQQHQQQQQQQQQQQSIPLNPYSQTGASASSSEVNPGQTRDRQSSLTSGGYHRLRRPYTSPNVSLAVGIENHVDRSGGGGGEGGAVQRLQRKRTQSFETSGQELGSVRLGRSGGASDESSGSGSGSGRTVKGTLNEHGGDGGVGRRRSQSEGFEAAKDVDGERRRENGTGRSSIGIDESDAVDTSNRPLQRQRSISATQHRSSSSSSVQLNMKRLMSRPSISSSPASPTSSSATPAPAISSQADVDRAIALSHLRNLTEPPAPLRLWPLPMKSANKPELLKRSQTAPELRSYEAMEEASEDWRKGAGLGGGFGGSDASSRSENNPPVQARSMTPRMSEESWVLASLESPSASSEAIRGRGMPTGFSSSQPPQLPDQPMLSPMSFMDALSSPSSRVSVSDGQAPYVSQYTYSSHYGGNTPLPPLPPPSSYRHGRSPSTVRNDLEANPSGIASQQKKVVKKSQSFKTLTHKASRKFEKAISGMLAPSSSANGPPNTGKDREGSVSSRGVSPSASGFFEDQAAAGLSSSTLLKRNESTASTFHLPPRSPASTSVKEWSSSGTPNQVPSKPLSVKRKTSFVRRKRSNTMAGGSEADELGEEPKSGKGSLFSLLRKKSSPALRGDIPKVPSIVPSLPVLAPIASLAGGRPPVSPGSSSFGGNALGKRTSSNRLRSLFLNASTPSKDDVANQGPGDDWRAPEADDLSSPSSSNPAGAPDSNRKTVRSRANSSSSKKAAKSATSGTGGHVPLDRTISPLESDSSHAPQEDSDLGSVKRGTPSSVRHANKAPRKQSDASSHFPRDKERDNLVLTSAASFKSSEPNFSLFSFNQSVSGTSLSSQVSLPLSGIGTGEDEGSGCGAPPVPPLPVEPIVPHNELLNRLDAVGSTASSAGAEIFPLVPPTPHSRRSRIGTPSLAHKDDVSSMSSSPGRYPRQSYSPFPTSLSVGPRPTTASSSRSGISGEGGLGGGLQALSPKTTDGAGSSGASSSSSSVGKRGKRITAQDMKSVFPDDLQPHLAPPVVTKADGSQSQTKARTSRSRSSKSKPDVNLRNHPRSPYSNVSQVPHSSSVISLRLPPNAEDNSAVDHTRRSSISSAFTGQSRSSSPLPSESASSPGIPPPRPSSSMSRFSGDSSDYGDDPAFAGSPTPAIGFDSARSLGNLTSSTLLCRPGAGPKGPVVNSRVIPGARVIAVDPDGILDGGSKERQKERMFDELLAKSEKEGTVKKSLTPKVVWK